jgi:hypothetical protein
LESRTSVVWAERIAICRTFFSLSRRDDTRTDRTSAAKEKGGQRERAVHSMSRPIGGCLVNTEKIALQAFRVLLQY